MITRPKKKLDFILVCSVSCERVARHVARMGDWRGEWFWCGDSREGDHFEDLGVDGDIIA